jgi:hypothetical protein
MMMMSWGKEDSWDVYLDGWMDGWMDEKNSSCEKDSMNLDGKGASDIYHPNPSSIPYIFSKCPPHMFGFWGGGLLGPTSV